MFISGYANTENIFYCLNTTLYCNLLYCTALHCTLVYTTLPHTILHYFIHYTSYSFSALIEAHQRDTAVGLVNRESPRLKNPLLSSECKAVYQAPAPHNTCSTTTCAGKMDHELPVNQSKGHTYTNPRPLHYLTHAQSRTLSCRGESFKCQFHTIHAVSYTHLTLPTIYSV